MKRGSILLSLGLVAIFVTVLTALSQAQKPEHVSVPAAKALPEDVSSMDAITKATYETISGGVGVPRQWGRFFTLFDPNARLLSPHSDPQTGAVVRIFNGSQQDFVDGANPVMVREGFTERELGKTVKQFGNVATVLSSYEGKFASTGKVAARGVNIFTLYNDGSRWWVLSIIWDEEKPGNPIPAELQPKS